jgi:hypothetical protein
VQSWVRAEPGLQHTNDLQAAVRPTWRAGYKNRPNSWTVGSLSCEPPYTRTWWSQFWSHFRSSATATTTCCA